MGRGQRQREAAEPWHDRQVPDELGSRPRLTRNPATILGCALIGVMLLGGVARAQEAAPSPPQPPHSSTDEAARAHFERAKELYGRGHLEGAEMELLRALELRPSYKIHRTLGELREQMHDYAASIDSFLGYLEQGGERVGEAERAAVEARIQRLSEFVAHIDVQSNVTGAQLSIDGKPLGQLPTRGPVRVNLGRREVTLRKPGYQPSSKMVEVSSGARLTVRMDLSRVEHRQPTAVAPGGAAPSPPAVPADQSPSRLTTWSWVGFGAAGTMAIAGTVTAVLASNKQDDVRASAYVGDEPPAELVDMQRSAHQLAVTTDVLYAASVLTAGTTLYFTLTREPDVVSSGLKSNVVIVRIGPSMVSLDGRF